MACTLLTSLMRLPKLSKLTFSWVNSLLNLGYSKPLSLEDIPSLVSDEEADSANQKFEQTWESISREGSVNNPRNLVLWSVVGTHLKENILIAFYALMRTISVVLSPLILYALVNYSNRTRADLKEGVYIPCFLILSKVVESLSQRHWFFDSRRSGMKMRSALMVAVYRKQLNLSSSARRKHSAGEIVNYIAVDAYRMGEFPWWFHVTWTCALHPFLSISVLFGDVGCGALLGLVPFIIFGLLNVPFAKIIQNFQTQFMITQDERLRSTSEILNILATLRIMSEPVHMIPEALSVLIQVTVSFNRLNTFLLDDELNNDDGGKDIKQCSDNDNAVEIEGGNFTWDQESLNQTLTDVTIEIKIEQKIAVCGPIGSGKSSLLYAIVGEIPKTLATVKINGSLAYVSQTSWIQSGTIRDNILFGKPMDKRRYENAIRVCALDKDIDDFSHEDLTEISQRGINMSGGQKQRIQLARAVYNDADIYLLDDPFSAVDAHTGSVLFNECIMNALREKTVILVTHQVEFLSEVDKILVTEDLLTAGTTFEQLVSAHKDAIKELDQNKGGTENEAMIHPEKSHSFYLNKDQNEGESSTKGQLGVQLTQEEEKEIGGVGWKPFWVYLSFSGGSILLCMVILAQSGFVALQTASTFWIGLAIEMPKITNGPWLEFTHFTKAIFNAPMLFFDSTLVGRILTRASSDLSILDFDIPYSISFVAATGIEILVIGYYQSSARELIRINGTTKAPVMNYAAETSLRVVTIRVFNMVDRFFKNYLRLVDTDATLFFHSNVTMEWLLLRIEVLQNLTVFTAALLVILLPRRYISPGLVGLSFSYALSLTIRYRPNAPLFLKGITCSFKEGSRVGVVGRTGSGKTTLISALFRLVEPASGNILIDGINICSIGLKDLRMKLSIIPQEPTLFKGSIRTNLDPLGVYSDEEIWKALEKCQLKETINNLPSLLDSYDEATASIDSATDAILQGVIRQEFEGCTVITVAHRVPTVIDSDMVMSYGNLVEYDEPSKLMETNS
ncbi:hypothetical protein TanjilG_31605 [Lupinus angustifolius]|uniref:ABC-type xenobiotic transporter n=1 Tax=Lupinus angustifolius TaxID=3871 RepID=A0A4P1RJA3_LUPAN|nr:hypothetical protein TanjilG_31605 [Lupinus angustifolius]